MIKNFVLSAKEQLVLLTKRQVTGMVGDRTFVIAVDEKRQVYVYSEFNDFGELVDTGDCTVCAKGFGGAE